MGILGDAAGWAWDKTKDAGGGIADAGKWTWDRRENFLIGGGGLLAGGPLGLIQGKLGWDNAAKIWDNKATIGGTAVGAVIGGPAGAALGMQAGRMADGMINPAEDKLGGTGSSSWGKGKGGGGGGAGGVYGPAQQQSADLRDRYAAALAGYQSSPAPFIRTTTQAPAAAQTVGQAERDRLAYIAALSGRAVG